MKRKRLPQILEATLLFHSKGRIALTRGFASVAFSCFCIYKFICSQNILSVYHSKKTKKKQNPWTPKFQRISPKRNPPLSRAKSHQERRGGRDPEHCGHQLQDHKPMDTWEPMDSLQKCKHVCSVAFCSPAKSLTFSGLVESPIVGKQLKLKS